MLPPEKVKPFILHPERVVKDYAVQYFSDSFNKDPELLPLVLQSVVAEATEGDIKSRLYDAAKFMQTRETLEEIFRRLRNGAHYPEGYNRLIAWCDVRLLSEFTSELELLTPATREKVYRRIRLAKFATERLWKELWRHTAVTEGNDYVSDEYDYGIELIMELIKRPDFPVEDFECKIQTPLPDDYDGYGDAYLNVLIGELKFQKGLPYLLQNLRIDMDLLNETAMDALIKLGTVEVVREIEKIYFQEPWHFRIYATGVLGGIKLPETEEVLLRLLEDEDDESLATILASELCKMFSVQAIPRVLELINHGYDQEMLCLEEELYVDCVVNGKELPEMLQWRELIAENQANMDAWDGTKDFPEIALGDENEEEDEWEDEDDVVVVQPRRVVKVGRNDPCPCGSGKKYKKCCLMKEEN